MIIEHLYLKCPEIKCDGEFRCDHILGKPGEWWWYCDECHRQIHIVNKNGKLTTTALDNWMHRRQVRLVLHPKDKPVYFTTIGLITSTHPTPTSEEVMDAHESNYYFYEEHTCPTNWLQEIQEVEFEGDTDPHGLFEYVGFADNSGDAGDAE